MTDNDPAFLWETEALRSNPQRTTEADLDNAQEPTPNGQWVTLREASRATGIPVETLRKWARRATVPTYLAAAQGGTNIRLVDLEGVERRAADLGRPIEPTPVAAQPEAAAAAAAVPAPAPPTAAPQPPPGTMIVPVDAWNKMLNQLGNLHEAGQSLAEARERAAKAETEAKFLRERLAELRQGPTPTPSPPVEANPAPPAAANFPADAPEKVWRYLMRRVRDRGNT
ncbi:MAG: hypothetical protein QNL12_08465 [Acidimicrobiia bacterium]|nr:hypothetical protein [Acidimicrobiia bacterium]MDX2467332.1 hypothetical protein [Acidimicrobiia bacterium]